MSHGLQHAFEAEEVMAYLDGALEADRAAALAAHLDGCAECQSLSKNFRQLTDRMMSFEVEPAPQSMNEAVLKAVEKPAATTPRIEKRPIWKRFEFWNWPLVQRVPKNWAIGGTIGAVALVLLLVRASAPNSRHIEGLGNLVSSQSDLALRYRDENAAPAPPPLAALNVNAPRFDKTPDESNALLQQKAITELSSNLAQARANSYVATASEESVESNDQSDAKLEAPDVKGPMIEQNVSLHIVPTNYDDASAAIEKLAAARGGYVGSLTATAQTGSARDVNVELRIPAKQADAFIADVRKLGKVVEETRTTEEVTAEYIDLQARMKASKAAEQRLVELLGTRTGKLSEVLEVERELARVRSEIESMQGGGQRDAARGELCDRESRAERGVSRDASLRFGRLEAPRRIRRRPQESGKRNRGRHHLRAGRRAFDRVLGWTHPGDSVDGPPANPISPVSGFGRRHDGEVSRIPSKDHRNDRRMFSESGEFRPSRRTGHHRKAPSPFDSVCKQPNRKYLGVAREVQLLPRLSHIPGWAGFAALKPDLRGRAMGVRRDPLFFCPVMSVVGSKAAIARFPIERVNARDFSRHRIRYHTTYY